MKENAASFLENYLPHEILSLIEMESLEIEKDSFITQDLLDYYSDLLYKVKLSGHDSYIYLLFEHKSYSEKWVTLQLLEYILQIWKLKKAQGKKLPIVIPLVLHHGKTKWEIGLKLSDLLEYKEEKLLKYVPDFEYILYDLASESDEKIKGINTLKVMLYLLKYVGSSEIVKKLAEIMRLLKDMPESEMEYLISITIYILHVTEIPFPKFVEIVEENTSRQGGEIIMTTAEQLILKGRKEGEESGIKKGKLEGIEASLEIKFGETGLGLMEKIRKISDIPKLTQVQQMIKKARNVEEMLHDLDNI